MITSALLLAAIALWPDTVFNCLAWFGWGFTALALGTAAIAIGFGF